ncbi:MAG: hypothetical protein J6I62_06420 [Selenomonadaceae bacterium]|nr:hypothetical protein [Selenomonadaceae bacterium]MBP3722865.1 hypothetical protein [Selenomonadaceae bacterium]
MAEKKFTHRAACPVDNERKEIEILYTDKGGGGPLWKSETLNKWCDKEETCDKRRGHPPRCPLFLAAPRFLPA